MTNFDKRGKLWIGPKIKIFCDFVYFFLTVLVITIFYKNNIKPEEFLVMGRRQFVQIIIV